MIKAFSCRLQNTPARRFVQTSRFLKSFMAQETTNVNQPHAGPVTQAIRSKITESLKPMILEVVDESSAHKGHAAMRGVSGGETHFRLVIVSDAFTSKSLVQRHRLVYDVLGEELRGGVHALSLTTKTPEEMNRTTSASAQA